MAVPTTDLRGLTAPLIGIGTWLSAPGEVGKALETALEAGVRLIDGAFMYQNEAEVGAVLKAWINAGKVKREELFVVTKLPPFGNREESVEMYLDKSLQALQLDYVDLYLIHCPVAMKPTENAVTFKFRTGAEIEFDAVDLPGLWRGMEKAFDAGKAKSIGVSNFSSDQCERVMAGAKVPIAANQVELHAYFQQKRLCETMAKLGIKLMAYAPLGSRGRPAKMTDGCQWELEDPVVAAIAKAHGKTPAQVLLRHLVQLGHMTIPKSTNAGRIKENFDILDFELSQDEMNQMDRLDKGSKGRTFDFEVFPVKEAFKDQKEFPFIARDQY